MNRIVSDILVVGGGAAGMSAALSASAKDGVAVTVADDNPKLGGQIWRAELGTTSSPEARKLIDAIDKGQVKIVNNAQVFAVESEQCLLAQADGPVELEFEKLIIATGARERFLPFPGWTLPNVLGAGGLQALVKGGLNVEGKRIVVAGTGPLLLAVAQYLRAKGATIATIAEQAPSANITRFARGLWGMPSKLAQAAALRAKLIGIPYLTDCWVTSAAGENKLESVTLTRRRKEWSVDCDYLACGFHLVPNSELPSLLGCEIENGVVKVDELQQTSRQNVFCAGEPTGIGGVEAAIIEGKIAGFAVTGDHLTAQSLFADRAKTQEFVDKLNKAFALRDELKSLAGDQTMVCRCEDVEYGRLKGFGTFRDAKLQTRCGMGPCQGRICGAATEFLFGWEPDNVRPPIFPVRMDDL